MSIFHRCDRCNTEMVIRKDLVVAFNLISICEASKEPRVIKMGDPMPLYPFSENFELCDGCFLALRAFLKKI